ncbi:MAG TPA: copper chaperone [Janthinobacterium sp.]|nr:copper chaperone [Janthinobacterium sp.]
MQTKTLRIQGMNDEGCADKITRMLEALKGVRSATVSLAGQRASIQFDEDLTSPRLFEQALLQAGYRVEAAVSGGCCGGCCGGDTAQAA